MSLLPKKGFSRPASDLQVAAGRSIGTVGRVELVVVAGEDGVEQDALSVGGGVAASLFLLPAVFGANSVEIGRAHV